MVSILRSWWQKIKQHPVASVIIMLAIALGIALLAVLILGYVLNWGWTGLTLYKNSGLQPGKTLWDWLQLLIIPAVLAVGGYVFNYTTSRNERNAADRHNQTEREIAQDNQREAALQEYIDKMSELLLHEKLREAQLGDEVRTIAHVRTLTVLPRLDSRRKASVLTFLYESSLIQRDNCIIDLHGADLCEANLYLANLSGADLQGANLRYAHLLAADLSGADLSGADLLRAKTTEERLDNAIALKGATMPDGSIHA